jgi:hypothetical protein
MKMAMMAPSIQCWGANQSTTSDKQLARRWRQLWTNTLPVDSWTNTATSMSYSGMDTLKFSFTTSVTGSLVTGWPTITGSLPADPAAGPPKRLPAPLAFSPYISATELVVEFLNEAREKIPGLTRQQFLRLTISDFFAFLIRRAAETDGVAAPELKEHDLTPRRARCGGCGRFLARRFELARLGHCGAPCLERAARKAGIPLAAPDRHRVAVSEG